MPVEKASKDDLKYWDKVLREHGLSMERGRANRVSTTDRRRRLTYAGDTRDLERIEAGERIAGE